MKSKDVLLTLDISRNTLYNYVKSGKIKTVLLDNGFYDYNEDSVFALLKKDQRDDVLYARVSTHKQKNDLNNQITKLQNYCLINQISFKNVYSEIHSGIDLDRTEFTKLLIDIMHYKIRNIYITNKDRLTRLSFKTLEFLFNKYGTSIIVIDDTNKNKNSDNEVFDELLSIIHIFSMKMYANRRKKNITDIYNQIKNFD